jgi:hypothetical protein
MVSHFGGKYGQEEKPLESFPQGFHENLGCQRGRSATG